MPRVNGSFSARCYEVSATIPPSLGSGANCAAWSLELTAANFGTDVMSLPVVR